MLAYMRYECGLKFKNVIFENENAAKLWLKQNGISNPNCYELVEVEFVKEDPAGLEKIELITKLENLKFSYGLRSISEEEKAFIKNEIEKIEKQLEEL